MSSKSRRKRRTEDKQYALDAKLNLDLKSIDPLTKNQEKVFKNFETKHIFLHGLAGTGKSFIAIYLAFKEIFKTTTPFKKLIIVRSLVQTRDMGHLPGDAATKMKQYEAPYVAILAELFGREDAYYILKQKGLLEFMSTSFIRGTTLHNSIILVDEIQNMNYGEASSVWTRLGPNCKLVSCGDTRQIDLNKNKNDLSGIEKIMNVCKRMDCFEFVDFQIEDICRSKFVKDFIASEYELGY